MRFEVNLTLDKHNEMIFFENKNEVYFVINTNYKFFIFGHLKNRIKKVLVQIIEKYSF
jgi:hypothetical protein